MCERLAECWTAQKVEWHVERGLKVNMDGSACLQGKAMEFSQVKDLTHTSYKQWSKEARMCHFVISSFKAGTLTAHMVSSGASANPKAYA